MNTTTICSITSSLRCTLLGLMLLSGHSAAFAQTTGITGSSPASPVNNSQPSLAIHFAYQLDGIYGEGVPVRMFAIADGYWNNLMSNGWVEPDGRLLNYDTYPNTYNQIGITYGPSSTASHTFIIPDLRSRTPGMAYSGLPVGTVMGAETSVLTVGQLPAHSHGLPVKCSVADIAGGGCDGLQPDGIVVGTDFIAFINSFSLGLRSIDPLADVAGGGASGLSPDGTIDGTDFIAFINAFAEGC